jgi:hypothetical protein
VNIYGSVLEIIHAMVNRIGGAFQSLEGGRQTKQVLHFLSAESDRAMKRQRKEIKKKEEKIEQGKKIKEPKRQ